MLKNFTFVAVSLLGMAAASTASLPTPSLAKTSTVENNLTEVIQIQETEPKEVAPKEKRLTCKGCNSYELLTLNALQDRGITDKVALATIMANIRQESQFVPNVCEGGGRMSYQQCRSGGYGAIQWTSIDRYNGLGYHAKRIGGDPSSFNTQLDYMFTETQWKRIEDKLKLPNKPVNFYMRLAYSWLGWGIKGPRETYAYDYLNRLTYEDVSA